MTEGIVYWFEQLWAVQALSNAFKGRGRKESVKAPSLLF